MLDDSFNDSKSRAGKILGSLVGRGRSPDQKTPLFRWSKTIRTGSATELTYELTIGSSFGWMIVIVVSLLIGTSTPLGRIFEFLVKFLR